MKVFLGSLQFVVASANSTSSSTGVVIYSSNNNNNNNNKHVIHAQKDDVLVWREMIEKQLNLQQHQEQRRQRRMLLPRQHPVVVQQQPPTLSPELMTVSSSPSSMLSSSSSLAATTSVLTSEDRRETPNTTINIDAVSLEEDDTSVEGTNHLLSVTTTTQQSVSDPIQDDPRSEWERWRDDTVDRLYVAVKQKQARTAIRLFRQARSADIVLSKKLITNLFYFVAEKDPLAAYEVLHYYYAHHKHWGGKVVLMYKRMCWSVRLIRPYYPPPTQAHELVESLIREIDEMDDCAKKILYPILVVTLGSQKCVSLGPYAGTVYDSMIQNGYPIKVGWLARLLNMSKYNRQEDLPFHDILARIVAMGGQPHPMSSLSAIFNMFPYTDANQMYLALSAWLDFEANQKVLQHQLLQGEYEPNNEDEPIIDGSVVYFPFEERKLDLSTLEMISMGAAKAGSLKLVLLIWDILEHCEYLPTETIYENTVIAFALTEDGIHQAFTAMESMKEDGFPISRALIRSFSAALRSNLHTIDNAFQGLLDDQAVLGGRGRDIGSNLMSVESLNVLMSSYAERGETERIMSILDIMEDNGIQPNADSFSFAIESLGKDIHRRKKWSDTAFLRRSLENVKTILDTMDDYGVPPSSDVIRHYVELLCLTGEVETATSMVEELIADNSNASSVNSKTIYRVALANAEKGDLRRANELASKMSEYIPILHRKIRSRAMRLAALEVIDERHRRNNDLEESSQ
jgi:pentatricopeptide repeat protein